MSWDDAGSDSRPGVLVAHAWGGRGDHEQHRAEQLAELGYVGFALDMFGKGIRGSSKEENAALIQPFLNDRAMLQRRMKLALDVMRKQADAGVDVINSGGQSRVSFSTYVTQRMSGFGGSWDRRGHKDQNEFPGIARP